MKGELSRGAIKYIQARALLLVGTIYESEFIVEQFYAEYRELA